MLTKRNLSAVVLAVVIAAPLTAQGNARTARGQTDAAQAQAEGSGGRAARRRTDAAQEQTSGVLTRERLEQIRNARRAGSTTASSRIPRGHLPPRGMCRVWVDGVPPGQQPAVTTCARAEQDRFAYGTNARVVYGDQESFPGRGNGKFKQRGPAAQSSTCVYRDAVVVGDRVVNVCRDANGNVVNRDGRVFRNGDDDDDDDRFENGRKSQSKAAKVDRKAAKKGGKGRG
jgi:hypothetical protein